MAALNKVQLIGNLGDDPILRTVPSGTSVCNLRLATTEKWTAADGEKRENTIWHRVVLWGRQAEIANLYLKKGRQIYVDGRLREQTWVDKFEQKRVTMEIVAQNFIMLGPNPNTVKLERNGVEIDPADEQTDEDGDATAQEEAILETEAEEAVTG